MSDEELTESAAPDSAAPRVAVVTGGSRGFGLAITQQLTDDGWTVASCSRGDGQQLSPHAEVDGAYAMRCDVSNEDEVSAFYDAVIAELGEPTLLVNNAGVLHLVSFDEQTLEQWHQTLDVNLTGVFLMSRELVRRVKESTVIVNIGSIASKRPTKIQSAYATSKAGLMGLSRSMVMDLAPKHRVALVAVGLSDTELASNKSVARFGRRMTPNQRLATPEDVARTVAFVADHEHVGGEAIVLDGGFLSTY